MKHKHKTELTPVLYGYPCGDTLSLEYKNDVLIMLGDVCVAEYGVLEDVYYKVIDVVSPHEILMRVCTTLERRIFKVKHFLFGWLS